MRILPHSPNWDSIQVADYIEPYLGYVSNEQIVIINIDQRKVEEIFRFNKIRKSRCTGLKMIQNKQKDTIQCWVIMQDYMILVKEIKISINSKNEKSLQIMSEEKLISGIDKIKVIV